MSIPLIGTEIAVISYFAKTMSILPSGAPPLDRTLSPTAGTAQGIIQPNLASKVEEEARHFASLFVRLGLSPAGFGGSVWT